MLLDNGICQPVEILEGILVRKTLDHNGLDELDLDVGEHFYDRLRRLSSPAVGSNDRCEPDFGFEYVCQVCGVHDLGMGAKEDRGCCHHNRSRVYKRQRKTRRYPYESG